MNEPRRWTFLCIWYENRWCWVHEVERLCFRSTWPCVYPSFYGSEPPVSTRITVSRVLTSFVPPVHNQGQGPALWKIFLPTTGSFFVISLTVLHGYRAGTLRWTFRPAGARLGDRLPGSPQKPAHPGGLHCRQHHPPREASRRHALHPLFCPRGGWFHCHVPGSVPRLGAFRQEIGRAHV